MDNETPEEVTPEAENETPEVAAEAEAPAAEEVPAEAAASIEEAPVEAAPTAADAPAEEAPAEETVEVDGVEVTLGSGGPADENAEPIAPAMIRGKIDRFGVAMGTGRRKTSVARVRIKEGDGKLTINGRELSEYFTTERDRNQILAPLNATDSLGSVDVWVRVNGGGTTGQAGAIVLGIARALEARNPTLHSILSEGGFLTRDGRMVERKKYGFRKARRSFQFSKR